MKGTGEKSDIAHDTFCVEVKLRKYWGGKASGLKGRFIPIGVKLTRKSAENRTLRQKAGKPENQTDFAAT
jgi:hypothetical protein